MTPQAPLAHGVVQVRLSGHLTDADALAAVLAGIPAVQILTGPDGPYPNRRQPGHRLYLTLRLTQPRPKPEPAGTPPSPCPPTGATPMSTEPTYDASNVHLAKAAPLAPRSSAPPPLPLPGTSRFPAR